jgi:leucyl-tRNA synthetase
MQTNWIGRSEGASIRFEVPGSEEPIEVFTTRPDTLYGATFLVLAAEHPLVRKLQEKGKLPGEAAAFVERLRRVRVENRFAVETEKEGFATGLSAVHPLTGKSIPVWVANYVLMGYGTGAIMAVPAHDQRVSNSPGSTRFRSSRSSGPKAAPASTGRALMKGKAAS